MSLVSPMFLVPILITFTSVLITRMSVSEQSCQTRNSRSLTAKGLGNEAFLSGLKIHVLNHSRRRTRIRVIKSRHKDNKTKQLCFGVVVF